MFTNISWLFFDVGSTLIDEQIAYKYRMQDIAEAANTTYQKVYDTAIQFYNQNKNACVQERIARRRFAFLFRKRSFANCRKCGEIEDFCNIIA